jgi:hypothetical protein
MENFNWFILIDFIDYFLKILLIGITAFFIYSLIVDDMKIRTTHYKYRLRVKRQQLKKAEIQLPQKVWFKHLYNLFAIRSTKVTTVHVYAFILMELFIGLSVFISLVIRMQDAVIAFLCSSLAMGIPYMFLSVSARNIRNQVSGEIQDIVQTLIHSYSATRADMYAALNMTHGQLKNKNSRVVLARLISDLQTAHDDKSLRGIVDFFIYSTGSSWGLRLGNIVLKSYVYQENVTTALLTLQQQMITHKKMLEEEKAGAADISAVAILSVILFPVSLIGADIITNPQNWWKLQFGDPVGFFMFTVTLLFVAMSGGIALIVRKPKNDL